MKATILQPDLHKGLGIVGRVVASRGQLPVLANVLIGAEAVGITLAATNLEIGLRTEIGGKVTTGGTITVPGRSLAEFVGSLSGESVTLETADDKLKITSGNFTATLAGIAASEFPVLPQMTGEGFTIDSQIIGQIATQVAYAAASDESRPVLTGIQIKEENGTLVVTATDGFRLSRKTVSGLNPQISNLILPARTIMELARLVQGEDPQEKVKVEMVKGSNQVIFGCGPTQLISRVLEGNFPDTTKILPTQFQTQVWLDRLEWLQALRAAAIFARESANIVKFKMQNAKCKISATAPQLGENESEIEAEVEGDEVEIAFNYKFVEEFLSSVGEERVRLRLNGNLAPGVFLPGKDDSLTALIMPVRVQS